MSKRVVSQQVNRTLSCRHYDKATITRCFSTSSSTHTERTKTERKKEANLRHAINLYHITDYFFPTMKKKDKSTEFDKELDSHIRYSIMGNTTQVTTKNNLDGTVSMRGAHTILSQKAQKDEDGFGSIFGNSASKSSEAAVSALRNSSRGRSGYQLEPELPLPPVEDREAVEKYIAETARRAANVGGLPDARPGDDLDVRGAQVRDALFGTVGGVKPGLEAVRERVTERQERARLEEQAAKAASSSSSSSPSDS